MQMRTRPKQLRAIPNDVWTEVMNALRESDVAMLKTVTWQFREIAQRHDLHVELQCEIARHKKVRSV